MVRYGEIVDVFSYQGTLEGMVEVDGRVDSE